MIVRLRAFAQFKELIGNDLPVELAEGTDIMGLFQQRVAGRPEAVAALFESSGRLKEHVILMVNRKRVSHDQAGDIVLHDGDEVAIFPPVAGG